MEKMFAFTISGTFATVTAGMMGIPTLFAQADAMSLAGLAERLGLGLVMGLLGYKIIIHIIDVFSTAYIAKLNAHDTETKEKLALVSEKISKIDECLSSVLLKNDK